MHLGPQPAPLGCRGEGAREGPGLAMRTRAAPALPLCHPQGCGSRGAGSACSGCRGQGGEGTARPAVTAPAVTAPAAQTPAWALATAPQAHREGHNCLWVFVWVFCIFFFLTNTDIDRAIAVVV